MTKTIAVLLFDGVEELDAVGPFEVLAGWTRMFPLHLVARLGGEEQARRVRKFLQYDPAPPV